MNKPFTVSTFDATKISVDDPESKKSSSFTNVIIPIKYNNDVMTLKIQGRLKIFEHVDENTQKKNYSIGVSITDENRQMFEEIKQKISLLAEGKKPKVKKLNSKYVNFHKEDLNIIKNNSTGEYPKV